MELAEGQLKVYRDLLRYDPETAERYLLHLQGFAYRVNTGNYYHSRSHGFQLADWLVDFLVNQIGNQWTDLETIARSCPFEVDQQVFDRACRKTVARLEKMGVLITAQIDNKLQIRSK